MTAPAVAQEPISEELVVLIYEKDGKPLRLPQPPRWWRRNARMRTHGRRGPQMMRQTEAQQLRDDEPVPWQWSHTKVRPWVRRDRNRAANKRARTSRNKNR